MPRSFSGRFYYINMNNIKNIIFDLGNVLTDIDYNRPIEVFEKIGLEHFTSRFSPHKMDVLFENLETGKISDADFYDSIKKISDTPLSNSQIENAWNALFLNFRTESLHFLEKMSVSHNLYLLSNTNSIHLTKFKEIFTRDTGKPSLDSYFIKTYYSNLIGLRKPDTEAYAFVLQDAKLVAAETLFIDDLVTNIEGAKQLGIQTHHLLPGEKVELLNIYQ